MEPVKIKPQPRCPDTGKRLTPEEVQWQEAMSHHFPKPKEQANET